MSTQIVILGGGQAAMQAAMSLRDAGFSGSIHLVCAEPELPYKRPPLSKGFLKGDTKADALVVRFPGYFAEHAIDLHINCTATHIDRQRQRVTLHEGAHLPYDILIIATGTRVRKLSGPGADMSGITYLRDIADAQRLKTLLPLATNISIVGGGFIGLEFAAVAARIGKQVTVIETQDRLMSRAIGPMMSNYFRDLHQSNGVDVRLATAIDSFEGHNGQLRAITLAGGGEIEADLVLAGIGVVPNIEIAETAGLACNNGLIVDEHLRTSDPHIFAIGDCARFPSPFSETPVRLESVQNAIDQGKHVAQIITGTAPTAYAAVPWFWTEQYEAMLQMAGLNQGFDEERLRGDPKSGAFSVDYLRQGQLLGVDSVNMARDHLMARRALAERKTSV